MNKNVILITGSNGEMGKALIQRFIKNKSNTIITLDLNESSNDSIVHDYFHGSILDKNLLSQINFKYKINSIYHLAAILSTKAEQNPGFASEVNINGTQNMIEMCTSQFEQYSCVIPFFFPSSIAVYNMNNEINQPVHESMYCSNPNTTYGKSKLQCELDGVNIEKLNNRIDFRCIRFPGIISATTIPTGGTSDYAPEMVHAAAKKNRYDCFVSSKSTLPFIVMPDAILAIEKIMSVSKNKLSSNIYNITSFSPNVNELFDKVSSFFNKFQLEYVINKERQAIVDSWPDSIDDNLARVDWNWKPKYDFNDAYDGYIIPSIRKYYN